MSDLIDNSAEREEIELLLPWYVNGTLEPQDAARVSAYLASHPEMNAQVATLRQDMAEAIHANEAIDAPPAASLDRLMAQIEAQAPASKLMTRHAASGFIAGILGRIDDALRSLSPGRLGLAAMAAAAIIAVQTGVMSGLMLSGPPQGPELAGVENGQTGTGTVVLMQFAAGATASDVTAFLAANEAQIIEGPKPGGFYRVRVGDTKLDEAGRLGLIKRLSANKGLVTLVVVSQ